MPLFFLKCCQRRVHASPVRWVSYALRMAAFLQSGYEDVGGNAELQALFTVAVAEPRARKV